MDYPDYIHILRKLLANVVWIEAKTPRLLFEIDDQTWSWQADKGFSNDTLYDPTCRVRITHSDLMSLLTGKAAPQKLLQTGQLDISGLHADAIGLSRMFLPHDGQKQKWSAYFADCELQLSTVTSEGRRLMLEQGLQLIAALEEASGDSLQRVRQALTAWAKHTLGRCDNQQWKRLDVPGLTTAPWTSEPDIDAVIEGQYDALRKEIDSLLTGEVKAPHYGQTADNADEPVEGQTSGWRSYNLVENGVANIQQQALFPVASHLVTAIQKDKFVVHAGFLILEPGVQIPAHSDGANWLLSYQYGVVVPENCYLEVCGERRFHRQGGSLVFNDSYVHCAANDSDKTRILFAILYANPQFKPLEIKALKQLLEVFPANSFVYAK